MLFVSDAGANISPVLSSRLSPSCGHFIPYVGSLGWGSGRERSLFGSNYFMFLITRGLFSSWNPHRIRNSDWAPLSQDK